MFFRQQDELRRLKEELTSKDVRIRQLELELNNLKNVSPNNVWPPRLLVWHSCFCCSHFWPLITNLLSLPAFFSYITHVVISFWKFIKTAGQAWNTAGIWRRGKIYLLPPWNWWGHSLRSKLRFQIYFNPAHLTFSYFLHECWEWATALILISPKQKCFFFFNWRI